jgi:hypothetical protein
MMSAKGDGIYIVGEARVVLSRNNITGCGAHGVYVWQGSVDMRDNKVHGSQYHGVFVFSGSEVFMRNNVISDNQRAGVFVVGTCELHLNTFKSNLMSGVEVCNGTSTIHTNIFNGNGLLSVDASGQLLDNSDGWSREYMHFLDASEPFPAIWFNNSASGNTFGNVVNADVVHDSGNSDRDDWNDVRGRPGSSDILVEKSCNVEMMVMAALVKAQ